MKSGQRIEDRLIGPGSNDDGRKPDPDEYKPVKELTPELADKIWNSVQKSLYDTKVSKEIVLHHLKQLKAQIGKERKRIVAGNPYYRMGIEKCMEMIDRKIAKIKKV